ncbi:FtsX-like permease family protein [Microbispora amethystogenes]|uniref:ABC3 transporter permease protein domain-containing protein n=1 Tax=Microbispora amethystogenes TaxID=1427754 RepID=A0ABQ4FAA3_9ACTN|nr:FtsX-like permease family protein [Microbispora amethystogenes]GIH31744.1 hypothetical protein Mam01_19080 [Microbispora amethystogenes]
MNPLLPLRVHQGAAAVLALLALSASLLVAGLPRRFEAAYDRAAHALLAEDPAEATDLTVALSPAVLGEHITGEEGFRTQDRRWRALVPPSLTPILDARRGDDGRFAAKTFGTPVAAFLGPEKRRPAEYVNLGWVSGAERRVRYVEGSPPGPPATVASVPGHSELLDVSRFDIALPRAAAEKMDIPLGATLVLGHSHPVLARVTGLFEPIAPGDRFWRRNRDMAEVTTRPVAGGDSEELTITALTGEASLTELTGEGRDLVYVWSIAVDPSAVTARDAASVVEGVADYRRVLGVEAAKFGGGSFAEVLDTSLGRVLTGFLARLATARALMFLVLGGLVAVAGGVIALAVQLLTERMRDALALARARGASLGQVVAAGAGTAALAVVPAVLAGYGLSFLLPAMSGPGTPIVYAGPLVLAVATVGFAAARVALAHRTPLPVRRDDVAGRRRSPRRTVLELLVVVLALAGAYLLRSRGLTTGVEARGADPFLMLVPVMLTVAAALVTLRCYPYPLRLFARLAARARGAVPFVGLALAARAGQVGALPVLILLPALAVSVYGAVAGGTLEGAQRLAAWQATGAGARVERESGLPPEVIEKIRRAPGVRAVVPVDKGLAQLDLGGRNVTVVAVDLDAYRRLVAGSPLKVPSPPPDDAAAQSTPVRTTPAQGTPAQAASDQSIPALVSPDLAHLSTFEIGWRVRMRITKRGVVTGGLPGLTTATSNLVVVPYDASARAGTRPYTSTLLVRGSGSGGDGLDGDRLRAAEGGLPDVRVVTVEGSRRKITATPLAETIKDGFRIVTIALAVYALLTVVIALVAGAADRARALSYLRALGLSDRRAAGLTVLEVVPMIALTACAGLALGLALPSALGPGVDLGVYAGDLAVRAYDLDLTTPVLLAAGLAAVAVAGAFLHTLTGRRPPGSVLRSGE